MPDLTWTRGGAEFSDDRAYRFKLWRRWNTGAVGRVVAFVMLNPSDAGEVDDDATIRRCIGYAKRWGFDGIDVVNLFAYVSTEPRALRGRQTATGDPRCLEAIVECVTGAARIVAAWGCHGDDHPGRVSEVLQAIRRCRLQVQAFEGATKSGQPLHPLRLAGALPLRTMELP